MPREEAVGLRLGRADRTAVQDITDRLAEVSLSADGEVVPSWLATALEELLSLEAFGTYRPSRRPSGVWYLAELAVGSWGAFFRRYADRMAQHPLPFHYDPLRPGRSKCNRVALRRDVCAHGTGVRCPVERCPVEEVWPTLGIADHDQIRVLVSSEASLLQAWVGGFRRERFTQRDRDVMSALVPALRRTVTLRRRLVDALGVRAATDAALGVLGAPAFVVRADGGVEHANPVGASLLEERKSEVLGRLRAAVEGLDSACDLARLTSAGGPELFLVVLREPEAAFTHRVAHVSREWGVTKREGEVLRWVVLGDSNKEIALRLACHESSVERHVTSLLRRARCDSRSRLVARFWTAR